MCRFLRAVEDRKGIVSTAELALQQQVISLYTDHQHWLRGLLRLDPLTAHIPVIDL